MNVKQIYENVLIRVSIDERRFIDFFNRTANELSTLYPLHVLEEGAIYSDIEELSDDSYILPLYSDAICDNIIYLAGGGAEYKSEFLRKADNAHSHYWYQKAKKRTQKRMGW